MPSDELAGDAKRADTAKKEEGKWRLRSYSKIWSQQ